ncbi:MAG: hypothetical protein IT510_05360 [Sulfuritalea sp.]|nr:hypothetical protein [Sulfuritalea sp.]
MANPSLTPAVSTDDLESCISTLASCARSVALKRVLAQVAPEPHLNFWRVIYGNLTDIAVLDWCKLFGSDAESTHWKNIVPIEDHEQFRAALFAHCAITKSEWEAYWNEIKTYRDTHSAHNDIDKLGGDGRHPVFDIALKSAFHFYRHIIQELRGRGDRRYPEDLATYYELFLTQSQ